MAGRLGYQVDLEAKKVKQLFLGLSGYQYSDWKGKFYPPDLPKSQWLAFYAEHFNTLEDNGSFYTSFKKSTYENWFDATPSSFTFAVKGHRFITQFKNFTMLMMMLIGFLKMFLA